MLELHNINKSYYTSACRVDVLRDVSLHIGKGEMAAVTGESGSGKSTLMNILGCLDTPDSGTYILNGKNTRLLSEKARAQIRNREIGFVFQGFNLIPALTAEENVELPLIYRSLPPAEVRRLSQNALRAVGLSHRMNHKPHELSGGQQQRTAIARAIAAKPPIILADEPTGNLDSQSGEVVLQMLKRLNELGRTVVLITHDSRVAASAQRQIVIADGRQVYP